MDVRGDFRVMGDAVNHLLYADTNTDNVGIGTATPAQRLDVDGRVRMKGIEFVSPWTGAITSFDQISKGTEIVTGGNPDGGVLTVPINFPTVFITQEPDILVTVRSTGSVLEADATFAASVSTLTSNAAWINIVRVDGGTTDGSWTQNLEINWMAWE